MPRVSKKNLNIVFIGMPGAGKTTLASLVAPRIDYDLVEIDDRIVEIAGKPITDIFAHEGEAYFRNLETQVVAECSKLKRTVISCGGGVIKKKENMHALGKRGLIFFIDRDLNLIETPGFRPLSSNRKELERLYEERIYIYRHYADITIENNGTIEEAVNTIISKIKEIAG